MNCEKERVIVSGAGRQELLDRDFRRRLSIFVLSRKCLHEGMRDQQS